MAVSRPIWKLLAPRRARKTGRKGLAALARPMPMASIWTYLKLRRWRGVASLGATDQRNRLRRKLI